MTQEPRFSTIFVMGLGHSGSTLVGRMLGMHPDALCVGEILRLDSALRDPKAICFCGAPLMSCPFWGRWIPQLPKELTQNYLAWNLATFDRIRSAENKKLLIDLSKSRAYRLTRPWNAPSVGYILLVRDPRGVMRSALQRNQNLGDLLKLHHKWVPRYQRFLAKQGSKGFTVFYEDLVAAPEDQLRRICDFAGIDFLNEMLAVDSRTQHLVKSSGSKYLKGANRIQQDERWREELEPHQIQLIERKLGAVPLYRNRYGLKHLPWFRRFWPKR